MRVSLLWLWKGRFDEVNGNGKFCVWLRHICSWDWISMNCEKKIKFSQSREPPLSSPLLSKKVDDLRKETGIRNWWKFWIQWLRIIYLMMFMSQKSEKNEPLLPPRQLTFQSLNRTICKENSKLATSRTRTKLKKIEYFVFLSSHHALGCDLEALKFRI